MPIQTLLRQLVLGLSSGLALFAGALAQAEPAVPSKGLSRGPSGGSCATTPDDSFEENDSFEVAARVMPGVYDGLFVSDEDPDYYVVSVPSGGILSVNLTNLVDGDATIGLLGAAGGLRRINFGTSFNFVNTVLGPPTDYVVRVLMDDPQGAECTSYSLDVAIGGLCQNYVPDAFEPNQDCTSPPPITSGAYPGLTVTLADPDYYAVTLQPGERLIAEQTSPFGERIEMTLLDSACSEIPAGGSTRRVVATNAAGTTSVHLVLRVAKTLLTGPPCGVYDLDLVIEPDPCPSIAADAFEDNDDLASAPTLTAGTYSDLNVSVGDPDYYRFELLPNEIARPTLDSIDRDSISVRLLDAGGNPTTVPWVYLTAVGSTVPVTYFWEVTLEIDAPVQCATYELMVQEATSACILDPDDALEDNDTIATAIPLTFDPAGGDSVIDDLFVSELDLDYFAFTVSPGSGLRFSSSFFTEWRAYTDQGVPLTNYQSGSPSAFISGLPTQPTTLVVGVRPRPSFGEQCFIYSIFYSESDSGCTAYAEDALEDHDTCLTPLPVTDGTYPGLAVFATDPDYFSVGIASGNDLHLSVTPAAAGANLPSVAFFVDADSCEDQLRLFPTNSGAEQQMGIYVVPNRTGVARDIIVAITASSLGTSPGCTTYDLSVEGTMTAPPERLGSIYCESLPNSTGSTARLAAWGSPAAAENRVSFVCTNLPTYAVGFLLSSRTQGFVPAGAIGSGNLCLGGTIDRFARPGEILDTRFRNEVEWTIDLQDLPMGSGSTSAQAGETWNFQYWTRDAQNGVLTSNLSNGLEVTWQ